MRNLIKAALLLLFISFSIQSFPQFRIGVKAGLSLTNIYQNFDNSDDEWQTVPRLFYSFGPSFDIGFKRFVSLQPALLFSAKGWGLDPGEYLNDDNGYFRFNVYYLELPINVAFKFRGFQVYAGPYLALAMGGRIKYSFTSDGIKADGSGDIVIVSQDADWTEIWSQWSSANPQYPVKRFDYGLNFGLGYKLGPILINTGLCLGLANLTPGDINDSNYDPSTEKMSNITGTLSVTYFFGRWR